MYLHLESFPQKKILFICEAGLQVSLSKYILTTERVSVSLLGKEKLLKEKWTVNPEAFLDILPNPN